jgi:hypothetical protein
LRHIGFRNASLIRPLSAVHDQDFRPIFSVQANLLNLVGAGYSGFDAQRARRKLATQVANQPVMVFHNGRAPRGLVTGHEQATRPGITSAIDNVAWMAMY